MKSTPTRTRTWTARLEDECDRPFHHRGSRAAELEGVEPKPISLEGAKTQRKDSRAAEGEGFEPPFPFGRIVFETSPAKPYPATFPSRAEVVGVEPTPGQAWPNLANWCDEPIFT